MSTTTLLQSFQKAGSSFMPSSIAARNQALPVSQSNTTTAAAADQYSNKEQSLLLDGGGGGGVRRRLSSLSLNNLQDSISSSPAASWAFHRSKSVSSSMGEYYVGSSIRKWWEWGWAWVLSRKPTFAQDLEMNEEETSMLGCHNKGSWRHLFYKVRSELRKLVRSSDNVDSLPQTFRYDDGIHNNKIRSTTIPSHPQELAEDDDVDFSEF